jgi:hypothetical protein
MAKPTNIVWEKDEIDFPYMTLTWKGVRFRLYADQKPQFIEQGLLMLPSEAKELVPPRKYASVAWEYFPSDPIEGLADDDDLFAAWMVFRKAAERGDYAEHLGPQG